MPKIPQKTNRHTQRNSSAALNKIKRNIFWQAGLAVATILLTVVIIFGMTSAWYTNIVQSSGLVFQAEAWGFKGSITVNEDPILAAPGDEGVIHLEVANEDQNVAAVSVNISKARMTSTEMRKRLYFYVDTQMIRNGETMNRVYLNNQDSYTYTVFGNGKLTLKEDIHNDAQLKWQWVYDVLGYYVLGEWDADNEKMEVIEYLRPIEYNYDEATTTFAEAEDGTPILELATTDGETSVEDFLKEFSKTDGYVGEINPEDKLDNGFYPVDVDEEGYGVYAYLCNYSEIEMATHYDTELGKKAAEGTVTETYEARLSISAQRNNENIVSVNTLAALNEALTLGKGVIVQLSSDLTVSDTNRLIIPENTQAILDLNGHTIQSETAEPAIQTAVGSSLTMLNGNLQGEDNKGTGIYSTGSEVILHKVNIQDFKDGIYVGDHKDSNTMDSRVRLISCEIHADSVAAYVSGNGAASEQKTQLIVENSKLYSNSIVICGSGNAGANNSQWGTDIQILNSELISNPDSVGAGIYHPQKDSTLSIVDSTVSGYTGIAIKGGMVYLDTATVIGSGTKNAAGFSNSGWVDTGDAVYIESNYGYDILLQIKGESKLQSTNGYSLQVYEPDASNVAVKIYGGTFKELQPEEYIAEGNEQTTVDNTVVVSEIE